MWPVQCTTGTALLCLLASVWLGDVTPTSQNATVTNHKYLFNPHGNHTGGDGVQCLCVTYEPRLSETFNLKQAEG